MRDDEPARRDGTPASTDPTGRRRWEDVLRSYADALDQHRALLLGVQPEGFESDLALPTFVPPDDLPPCPAELAPRLRALQHETAGLVELAQTTLAELKPVVVAHPHRSLAEGASASWMDTRL